MVPLEAGLALLIEAIAGYPQRLVQTIGHPVIWFGALIAALDRRLNRPAWTRRARRAAGVVALGVLLAASVAGAALVQAAALHLPLGPAYLPVGPALVALAASTLLAQRSLYQHVACVAVALETDGLAAGRMAVSRIVGRDPEVLDEHGVCRAAIESLAENFSDGVVAPAFWLVVAGLPGAAAYKAINTADSMIGHRTERYEAFGWAAARLDDLVNLPASRLSALLLVIAAALLSRADRGPEAQAGGQAAGRLGGRAGGWAQGRADGPPSDRPPEGTPEGRAAGHAAGHAAGRADGRGAWRAIRRDARHHRSPNAGWPEAAMAGALGLALAGPRSYGGQVVPDALMGDGTRDATPADIRRALRLFLLADGLLVGVILAAGLAFRALPG